MKQTAQNDLLSQWDRLTGATKRSFESLHRAHGGESDSGLQRSLRGAMRALQNEMRRAGGDPFVVLRELVSAACFLYLATSQAGRNATRKPRKG